MYYAMGCIWLYEMLYTRQFVNFINQLYQSLLVFYLNQRKIPVFDLFYRNMWTPKFDDDISRPASKDRCVHMRVGSCECGCSS